MVEKRRLFNADVDYEIDGRCFKTLPQRIFRLGRDRATAALTVAAESDKADIAKPLKGMEPRVFQVAIRYRTDACLLWRNQIETSYVGGRGRREGHALHDGRFRLPWGQSNSTPAGSGSL